MEGSGVPAPVAGFWVCTRACGHRFTPAAVRLARSGSRLRPRMWHSLPAFARLAALGCAVPEEHGQRPAHDRQQPFMTWKVWALGGQGHDATDENQTHDQKQSGKHDARQRSRGKQRNRVGARHPHFRGAGRSRTRSAWIRRSLGRAREHERPVVTALIAQREGGSCNAKLSRDGKGSMLPTLLREQCVGEGRQHGDQPGAERNSHAECQGFSAAGAAGGQRRS